MSFQDYFRGELAAYADDVLERLASKKVYAYVADVVINSDKHEFDLIDGWSFKTVAEYSIASFLSKKSSCVYSLGWSLHRSSLPDFDRAVSTFIHEAVAELFREVSNWLLYIPEGIRLYVPEGGSFREGSILDEQWQLAQTLAKHEVQLASSGFELPEWTRALYLSHDNVRAWMAIYCEIPSTNSPNFDFVKKLKKAAVDAYTDGRLDLDVSVVSPQSSMPTELLAACEAWKAVSGSGVAGVGRSVKQQIEAWVREHYPELSESACERIATVANWQQAGGAPRSRS